MPLKTCVSGGGGRFGGASGRALDCLLVTRRAADYPYFDTPFACMAHRGGYVEEADAARENSLYAFGRAVDLGYRYLETDVHATADGQLIAFHDDVLDRVTEASGKISELPYAAVREALIAGIDPIPTLDEVLDAFPRARLNIDIKAPSAIEPLVATLRMHRAQDRVCVSSFSPTRLGRFRRLAGPGVATGSASAAVALAAFVPLLPRLLPSPGVCYQVPTTQTIKGRRLPVLTPALLATARARGARVHVWTINDADQMHRLIDLGVDGLVTDRVDLLKQVAIERGLWEV